MVRSNFFTSLAGALLIVGGVFGTASHAQDYIDVEAQRRNSGGSVGDSVTGQSQPDPSYSGSGSQLSYGSQTDRSGSASPTGDSTVGVQGDASAGELFYQLQLLQQEVMELRGKVEEQEFQIRQLREQSLERYLDLDQRLKNGVVPGEGGKITPGTADASAPAPQQELPGESDAYRAAYSLVRSQQFNEAVAAFRQFLVDYQGGKLAPNAHYWLGELYLVQVPPDAESARREFTVLLEQYPQSSKIPDALYKLGKIYYDRGNRDRAREYLDRVVNEFGDSGSSAVKLARDFISLNF